MLKNFVKNLTPSVMFGGLRKMLISLGYFPTFKNDKQIKNSVEKIWDFLAKESRFARMHECRQLFGFLSNKNCVNICSHKKSSQNICPSAWWACYAITSSFSYKTGNNSWSKLNMHISSLNSSGSKAKKGGRSSRRSHIFCNKSFAPISPYSHQKLFSPLWSLQCSESQSQSSEIPPLQTQFKQLLALATTQFILPSSSVLSKKFFS